MCKSVEKAKFEHSSMIEEVFKGYGELISTAPVKGDQRHALRIRCANTISKIVASAIERLSVRDEAPNNKKYELVAGDK